MAVVCIVYLSTILIHGQSYTTISRFLSEREHASWKKKTGWEHHQVCVHMYIFLYTKMLITPLLVKVSGAVGGCVLVTT